MLLPRPAGDAPAPTVADLDALELAGCVVCGDETAPGTVCSRACAVAAEQQVAANIAELRRMPTGTAHRARRRFLTARNGHLTDAMLTWRPEPRTG